MHASFRGSGRTGAGEGESERDVERAREKRGREGRRKRSSGEGAFSRYVYERRSDRGQAAAWSKILERVTVWFVAFSIIEGSDPPAFLIFFRVLFRSVLVVCRGSSVLSLLHVPPRFLGRASVIVIFGK